MTIASDPTNISNGMRIVDHAGPTLAERILVQSASLQSVQHVDLAPGLDLFTFLEERVEAARAPGAFYNLRGGSLDQLTLMTGGPGVEVPITFHGPIEIDAPLKVEAGSGVIGSDEKGQRFSHCHAAFRRPDGRLVGGHLMRGKAVAGPDGVQIELFLLADARFARRNDPETQFTIFYPEHAL